MIVIFVLQKQRFWERIGLSRFAPDPRGTRQDATKAEGTILALNKAPVAWLASALVLGCLPLTASASDPEPEQPGPIVLADADRIVGHWQRGEGEAIIEVSQREGIYRGVIVWSERRPETIGIEVFRELRFDEHEDRWEGRAYSIKRKREVRIDIELPKHDHLELTAHILIFTKEVDFTRVPNAEIAARKARSEL